MGKIYALAGPSGVGKTTLLLSLRERGFDRLRVLRRATTRPRRPDEMAHFEYDFYSHDDLLRKLFAGDIVFPEMFDDYLYGIDRMPIEDTIKSGDDGVIMSGILGGSRLKHLYPDAIEIIYMHAGTTNSLLSPMALSSDHEPSQVLRGRLSRKLGAKHFGDPQESAEKSLLNRMKLNFTDISFVNGAIRRGETVRVLENIEDRLSDTIDGFCRIRGETSPVGAKTVLRPSK